MAYKSKFYSGYISTHVLPRKGEANVDELRTRSVAYQRQFGRFLPQKKDSKIVDIGCGNGSVVWWLQQTGFSDVSGIDISEEQIQEAAFLGIENLENVDLETFLKDKKSLYDVIFARDVLEHFNKDEIIRVLQLCYESLKNQGIIIIQVPNAESPFGNRVRYGDFTHEIAFTASSLSQVLRTLQFREVECHPASPPIYGVKSLVRFLLWKVVEAIYKILLFSEIGRGEKIVTQNIIGVAKK